MRFLHKLSLGQTLKFSLRSGRRRSSAYQLVCLDVSMVRFYLLVGLLPSAFMLLERIAKFLINFAMLLIFAISFRFISIF